MKRNKEIVKFLCGWEAFHALVHAHFWRTGTTLTVFGIQEGPRWHRASAVGNAVISLALGWYAWGHIEADRTHRSEDEITPQPTQE